MSFNLFRHQPTSIKLTLAEVQAQPTPRRPQHLLIDLTKFLNKADSVPQLFSLDPDSNLIGTQRSTTPINLGSLVVGEATKAAWLDLKTAPGGGDKAAPTAGAIKFTPIDGGVSAEQGERLIKVFRLAKLLCNDCYKVQMRLPTKLGGKVIEVAGVQEASFIREILEQGKLTGGRMSTPEV